MKKILTTILAVMATLVVWADMSEDVNTRWAKFLDSKGPDMGQYLTMGQNALFFVSNTGTTIGDGGSGWPKDYTDPTASIYYDGQYIGHGAYYEGASHNLNFNLLKTDLDGNMQWCVYSTCGEVASNNGGVVATSDGGVIVAFKMRHTLNMNTLKPTLVDASGAEWTIDWVLDSEEASRYYRGFLMKTDAQGNIQWIRAIDVDTTPQPAATGNNTSGTWDVLQLNSLVGDDAGNIYLAGRYVNPITFQGQNGSTTITPHNTEGWNGDSQVSVGDIFIAKMDDDGYLTDILTTTGKAYLETMPVLDFSSGDLILNFIAKGSTSGTDAISLDGHEVTLPTDQQCMITAKMTGDFKVDWVRKFTGEPVGGRNCVMQNNHIYIAGNNLWLTGMGNFVLRDDESDQSIATTTGTVREGYIIKCDLQSGVWIKATTSRNAIPSYSGITGWLGGFESEEHFYTYGYNWGGLGVHLAEWDKEQLTLSQYCTLIKGGQQTIANEMLAHGNILYTISRAKETTVSGYELQTINSSDTLHTMDWGVLFSAFELPFTVIDNHTTKLTGDVNGDGEVNIIDVNLVIDRILSGNNNPSADVNYDGEVNIADVNSIIDQILMGS